MGNDGGAVTIMDGRRGMPGNGIMGIAPGISRIFRLFVCDWWQLVGALKRCRHWADCLNNAVYRWIVD